MCKYPIGQKIRLIRTLRGSAIHLQSFREFTMSPLTPPTFGQTTVWLVFSGEHSPASVRQGTLSLRFQRVAAAGMGRNIPASAAKKSVKETEFRMFGVF